MVVFSISRRPRASLAPRRTTTKRSLKPEVSPAAAAQIAVQQLVARLKHPQPFRKVLDPSPELSLKARVTALRHCCTSASGAALRKAASNKGQSLLAALHDVRLGSEEGLNASAGPKRASPRKLKKKSLTAQDELNSMLSEAVTAEMQQEVFMSVQAALVPKEAKKAVVQVVTKPKQKQNSTDLSHLLSLRCCACFEEGNESSLVLCSLAMDRLKYAKTSVRNWATAPLEHRRRQGSRTLTGAQFAAEMLRDSMNDILPHAFCPGCLRKFIMGTSVHTGALEKMFCPGCTVMLRSSAQIPTRPGNPFDMTGLGLDAIRDRSWGAMMQPIDAASLAMVLGPLDLLQLCDLQFGMAKPPKLAHGLVEVLKEQDARCCPYCGHASLHGGGCDAVLCERCGLVFKWNRARVLRKRM